jgi:prevent-host-death family protein
MSAMASPPVRITATEASRRFADFLDRAKRGERFTVTRNGEAVAQIVPLEPLPNGAAVRTFFSEWAAGGVFDEAAAQAMAGFRDDAGEDRLSWAGP